jgi:cytochrome c-type biogenesis protein CcmH/NrfG
MMATRENEGSKKDAYLDQALVAIEKGKGIAPNESELVALEGFVHMIRVTVDPASRGQQYSGLAMQTFGKALGMNPNNPRAMSLLAQMQFGTAQFFKQQPTEACATASKALGLFDSATKSENPLAPQWGKEMTVGLIQNCK